METPKEPWNFCETPEEKCTMNYCDENGCQNRKRNLVEPKKSNLEQQVQKLEAEKKELLHFLKYFKQCVEDEDFIMVNNTDEDVVNNVLSKSKPMNKTKYIKVDVSERLPQVEKWFHVIGEDGNVDLCPFRFNEFFATDTIGQREVKYWLEEIPDNTQQVQKLEAEKKELLEALERVIIVQDKYFGEQEIHGRLRALCVEIESLIQKHK